ncbi:NapC/NirT family cytochrome c [Desulfurispirillum indicum]|uniref:NapC/NirT cytochrome c N-terminal domain-containing protein n=1 Tax=Desulfurispirillum indicum (strain ATCC BAA-1389 / DSM 22839 / S5) TaxID=653733 RepID=E6W3M0_DESIS|nr:NapC/NirT family cytochrome c [Desulfurispirillum indicum]ADU66901.1 hypothetical protein Selin_2181 [Desulfurispirillum indicum S5]UCZ56218.1 NapC/NirT family cytochrome c [Desulfurispirillum indicum]
MKNLSPKAWIIVGVVALFIIVGGTVSVANKTSSDSFCIRCHAYEKVSWDHGDHPDVGCIACHTKGMMTDKVKGIQKVYLTSTGQVNPHNDLLPSYKEAITENCIGCHLSREQRSERPIFSARHDEYMKYQATCMGCHDPGHVKSMQNQRFAASRR